jgi:ribonuclease Z
VDVIHCAHAFALVLQSSAGWKLVYSGDTRPSQKLAAAAKVRLARQR